MSLASYHVHWIYRFAILCVYILCQIFWLGFRGFCNEWYPYLDLNHLCKQNFFSVIIETTIQRDKAEVSF